jgi:uncharacterized RDD family membrane protein YckC
MAFCVKCGKELPASATFCPSCGTPVGQAAAPGQPASGFETLTREGRAQSYWLRRLFAFVIDAIIVNIALLIIVGILAMPFLVVSGLGVVSAVFSGVFGAFSGLVLVFYFAFFEVSSGSSIGKKVLGLKVTGKGGRLPNFGEAFVRNISKIYWILLLLDVVVGLATSKGFTQKYSDQFIGTDVVDASAAPSAVSA